jgi:hypothetical protein
MNGLLRHTSNIHIGKFNAASGFKFWGIVAGNIKAGYAFVANGYSTLRQGVIGLISNIKI